jgi:large subunit ribosomal protein L35
MPKIKTNRAAAKRFHKTKSGKFKAKRAYMRHILTTKRRKKKRRLRKPTMLANSDLRQARRLLPYA